MNTAYLPRTQSGRFWRVVEELGEVVQALGKAGRFGWENRYPATGPTNREKLCGELRDLRHAVLDFVRRGTL